MPHLSNYRACVYVRGLVLESTSLCMCYSAHTFSVCSFWCANAAVAQRCLCCTFLISHLLRELSLQQRLCRGHVIMLYFAPTPQPLRLHFPHLPLLSAVKSRSFTQGEAVERKSMMAMMPIRIAMCSRVYLHSLTPWAAPINNQLYRTCSSQHTVVWLTALLYHHSAGLNKLHLHMLHFKSQRMKAWDAINKHFTNYLSW